MRSLSETENKAETTPAVTVLTVTKELTMIKGARRFQAQQVFKLKNIFRLFTLQNLKPVIDDVLNGFVSKTFAYGQTSTGKTHTIVQTVEAIFVSLD